MASYVELEKTNLSSLGVSAPSFNGSDVSFFATSSFLYTLCFILIVGASFYRYVVAGVLRMQASENTIRQSDEIIRKATLGLLGVFSLFLILFTVNRDLLTGDVGLGELRTTGGRVTSPTGGTSVVTTSPTSGSGGSSASCEAKEATIAKLQSSGGICGGVTCRALTGCRYQNYMPIIESAVGGDIQLKKMIIVTMCKESSGNPNASNRNENGTYDCGLMQVNQNSPCESNPTQSQIEANIREGVSRMRQKISASSQTYPNIPAETGPFSAYNCCANNTIPNSPSADCNTGAGFPYSIPKWACPINPGTGAFNMCTVKNYVCELSACMKQL